MDNDRIERANERETYRNYVSKENKKENEKI